MAKLIKCKECSTNISKKAKICPQCGSPVKKKTGCLTWALLAFLIFLGIGFIGSLFTDTTESPQPAPHSIKQPQATSPPAPTAIPQPPTPTPAPLSEENIVERITQAANDVWGSTDNAQELPRVIEVGHTKRADDTFLINIAYRANENLTTKMTRNGIVIAAQDFIQRLSTSSQFDMVSEYLLRPHVMLIDQYGVEEEGQVGKFVLTREIAAKINWENMYRERFEQLLRSEGQIQLHPAFSKQ